MVAQIINRGRGPEIAGTRITVYDVLDYRKHGWHRDVIAGFFRLSSEQIQAAFDYIDAPPMKSWRSIRESWIDTRTMFIRVRFWPRLKSREERQPGAATN